MDGKVRFEASGGQVEVHVSGNAARPCSHLLSPTIASRSMSVKCESASGGSPARQVQR